MKKALLKILILCVAICSAVGLFTACSGVEFKINFVVDGEIYAIVNTNGSETIKMPDNPVKDDYTFDGWFWDKDTWAKPFTANSLLDTPLSSDMSVYCKWKEDQSPMERAEIVSANGFTFDGTNGKISVSNDTETYSFINQIQVNAKATWVISTDIYGLQTVATKTIPLNIGDNTVYLLVTSGDGNNINLYTMTIRRRPIYTVSFNTDGGTAVASQQIEEDSFAIEPTTTRAGYTFTGWNYDFDEPIADNTIITAQWVYYTLTAGVNNNKAGTITRFSDTKITVDDSVTVTAMTNEGYTFDGWYNGDYLLTSELNYTFNMPRENLIYTAKWTANTDTPYKVEYYLENLNDNNFSLDYTENLTGTTDTTAVKIVDRTYEHYNLTNDTVSGNINGDGSSVLKIYYYLERFSINITSSHNINLNNTYYGLYKYGEIIPDITATFNDYLGCEWQGWYSDNVFLTKNFVMPSFTVDKDIELFANGIKQEMSNFLFTSSTTKCEIYEVKDKTITEIIVPNYVTFIYEGAFSGCSQITSVSLPSFNGQFGALFGTIDYSGATKVGQNKHDLNNQTTTSYYYIPSQLKTVQITGNITRINNDAFDNCRQLTSIVLPNSITTIGSYAFSYCSGLTELVLPNSVITISVYAFTSCTGLTEIILSNSLANIGDYAFSWCNSLKEITIPNSVKFIGDNSFYKCDSLKNVYLENTTGWRLDDRYGYYYSSLTSEELSDALIVASYLKGKYRYYDWRRSGNGNGYVPIS